MLKSFLLSTLLLLFLGVSAQNKTESRTKKDSILTDSLNEVVITASKVPEKILQSPVSIQKLSAIDLQRSASPSFFDALANANGVQMITPSLGFKVINTRGFANPTNVRFVQLVDGIDNQAPHIGGPIGNAIGPTDLDIQSAEIIPGTASALYGMNAINGMANFQTKNPFDFQGVSFQQKVGFNKVTESDSRLFIESSIRFAKVLSQKLAVKINGSFTQGNDFIADNRNDLNPGLNTSAGITGANNPAYDEVNGYGNESSNRRTLNLNGKNYVIARTGYLEKEVVDYGLKNFKTDASLHYKISPATVIAYTYRLAVLNNVYQRSNRFRLQNYQLNQHSFSIQNPIFQIKAYQTSENTGKSYNLRSMAENLDRSFKKDDSWFLDYASGFNQAISQQQNVEQALQTARVVADNGRLIPGSVAFNEKLGQLQDINNWDVGAALRVKARMYHLEAQLNISEMAPKLADLFHTDILVGVDRRTYSVTPDGNYFINPDKNKGNNNLLYSKTGGFVQATKKLFEDKLKLGATLRMDKNDYFEARFNPRFTAVYTLNQIHNFRASFQSGSRFPSLFEAFSNVNSGGVKRVGGLRVMSDGVFENSFLRTSIDAFQAAVIKDVNSGGIAKDAAIKKNQVLLQRNSYTYLEPEKLKSFEGGYRGLLLKKRLFLDIDFYYNRYTSFIGQVEANIPRTSNVDSIAFYLNDKKLQDRYRLWTNSKTVVYNYGGSLGLKYNLPSNFKFSGNLTYSDLAKKISNDGLEDGFNTPKWITNISLGNPSALRNAGFNVTYKWQSNFYWQSFLVNGHVPSFANADAQVNYTVPKMKVMVKVGGTNILNKRYNSFLGGPQIGGFYYTSITLNGI
ncbi:MAG: TonB-dependent receptor [Sphingobacteriaceae bacterium]|nr:TonB-dependent receptor [Sphingobacteriaceae bacterium]